jgi:hypothetical protein
MSTSFMALIATSRSTAFPRRGCPPRPLYFWRSVEYKPQDRYYNRRRTSSAAARPLFQLFDRPLNPCAIRSQRYCTRETSASFGFLGAPRKTHHADDLYIFVLYLKDGRAGISKTRADALPQRVDQQHLRGEIAANSGQERHPIDPRLPQSTKRDSSADHKDQIARPNRRGSEPDIYLRDILWEWPVNLEQAKISDDPGRPRFELRRALGRGDLVKLPDAMSVLVLNPVARSRLHAVTCSQQEIIANHSGSAEGIARADKTYD